MLEIEMMETIKSNMPVAAGYELLAEECVECAHAALKMARIIRAENPTPVLLEDANANLREEISDIATVLRLFHIKPDAQIIHDKLERWAQRLSE